MTASGIRERDVGAAGVDAAMAVMALLATGMLVIGGLRITNAGGDVQAAARSAARAAAAEYQPAAAQAAASEVASAALADRGQSCRQLDVEVQGELTAGSVVTVTITCTVGLGDVVLAGFPGSTAVSGEAVEYVDLARGGQ